MFKFMSFGSGSSGNCYLLLTEGDGLLIDVGIGVRSLKRYFSDYGLNIERVHHVLITHDHASVHHGIVSNYCVRRKILPVDTMYLEVGSTCLLGDFSVTCFSVPHDSAGNVGYMIGYEGVHFCLITDAGHVTDEMRLFISKANYLVIEANHDEEMLRRGTYPEYLKTRVGGAEGHLSNRDCAIALAENASPCLRHVWLCHLSEENNHPELARKTVEMVLRDHGLVVGKDFMLDVLKRTKPSALYDLT